MAQNTFNCPPWVEMRMYEYIQEKNILVPKNQASKQGPELCPRNEQTSVRTE